MLKINMPAFLAGGHRWLGAQERRAMHYFQQMAVGAYNYIVMETPQYSGTTVGNWTFSVNGMSSRTNDEAIVPKKAAAYQKASSGNYNVERTMRALYEGYVGKSQMHSLQDKVFIANTTEFSDVIFGNKTVTRTVAEMETSPGWLRYQNQPGQMITRAVSYYSTQPLTAFGNPVL